MASLPAIASADISALRRRLLSVLSGPHGAGRPLPAAAWQWVADGQMLRARLLARLAIARRVPRTRWEPVALALELVHAASLVHDDVIDGALLRRHAPTLWSLYGPRLAILAGDSLLAAAFSLLAAGGTASGTLASLLDAARKTCAAEMARELCPPSPPGVPPPSNARLIAHARGKTGPLFAFAATCTLPGNAPAARRAFWEKTGSGIGLLYQISDDLADATTATALTGKTMGRDAARRLPTTADFTAPADLRARIARLRAAISRSAIPTAAERAAVLAYLDTDFTPALRPLAPPP